MYCAYACSAALKCLDGEPRHVRHGILLYGSPASVRIGLSDRRWRGQPRRRECAGSDSCREARADRSLIGTAGSPRRARVRVCHQEAAGGRGRGMGHGSTPTCRCASRGGFPSTARARASECGC
jgi:hypothetical protein